VSQETTYAGKRAEWQTLLAPLALKPPGLEPLEPFRVKLDGFLSRAVDITTQQAALAASKQELSQELQGIMVEGERVAALLRKGLKQILGPKAEQLTAYKVQPFRGRKVKSPVTTPTPAAQVNTEKAAEPAR
jgi:hypothetical protein